MGPGWCSLIRVERGGRGEGGGGGWGVCGEERERVFKRKGLCKRMIYFASCWPLCLEVQGGSMKII